MLNSNASKSFTIEKNKIYLVAAHGLNDKARIDLLSTVYSTHFTNLIGVSTLYLNYSISNETITFVNMESTSIGLSVIKL